VTYLLDTNICIYALKNRPPEVLERLRALGPTSVALSVITVLELRQGAEGSQSPDAAHARLDTFLPPMQLLSFEEEDALTGARLRADLSCHGCPIGDFDSLIAAQAITHDLILVTNNLREFERIQGLRMENWSVALDHLLFSPGILASWFGGSATGPCGSLAGRRRQPSAETQGGGVGGVDLEGAAIQLAGCGRVS